MYENPPQKPSKMEPRTLSGATFSFLFENLDFVQHYSGFVMFLPSRGVAGATFLIKKRVLELGCAFDTSKIYFSDFLPNMSQFLLSWGESFAGIGRLKSIQNRPKVGYGCQS